MENPTAVDLNEALRRWRADLQPQAALRPEDVAELESHLRESIARLQAQGLSPEEAYLVATERLGSVERIGSEFAKTHPERIWIDRAFWMVSGILLLYGLHWLVIPAHGIAWQLGWAAGFNIHGVYLLTLLAQGVCFGGGLVICGWLVMRHGHWIARLGGLCLRRPWMSGLALILLLRSLYPFAIGLQHRLVAMLGVGGPIPGIEQQIPILNAWQMWSCWIKELLWVSALPLLAGYIWRMRQREQAQPRPSGLEQLDPPGREIARSLQAQGLSDREVMFLAARRCGLSAGAESVSGRVSARLVWLERALWVVCGQVLLILQMNFSPNNLAVYVFGNWAQTHAISDHVTGPIILIFSLAMDVALLVALWKFVIKFQRQTNGFGHWCGQRPVRVAMVLILIFAGLYGGMWQVMSLVPANGGIQGSIIVEWYLYESLFLDRVLPVVLFVWLAQRRLSPAVAH